MPEGSYIENEGYRQYYSDINFNSVPQEKIFIPNKYYYCMEEDIEDYDGIKHYALANTIDHKAFYEKNPICVVSSSRNIIPVGSEWNKEVQPVPYDIELARRTES